MSCEEARVDLPVGADCAAEVGRASSRDRPAGSSSRSSDQAVGPVLITTASWTPAARRCSAIAARRWSARRCAIRSSGRGLERDQPAEERDCVLVHTKERWPRRGVTCEMSIGPSPAGQRRAPRRNRWPGRMSSTSVSSSTTSGQIWPSGGSSAPTVGQSWLTTLCIWDAPTTHRETASWLGTDTCDTFSAGGIPIVLEVIVTPQSVPEDADRPTQRAGRGKDWPSTRVEPTA